MKIKSIKIEGFHNVVCTTYTFDSNLVYLLGPNGAGKSTILEAIQLALLGYIPNTNKTKSAIFQHANNHTMAVTLVLDDNGNDVTIQRIWTGNKSDVKTSVTIEPVTYSIEHLISDMELPIFNFNEFVGMTANKLKDWFIKFLPNQDIPELDWEHVLTQSLVDADKERPDDEFVSATLRQLNMDKDRGNESLQRANTYLSSMLSMEQANLKRLEGTIQSLVFYEDIDVNYSLPKVLDEIAQLKSTKDNVLLGTQIHENNLRIMESIRALDLDYSDYDKDPRYSMLSEGVDKLTNEIAQLNSDRQVYCDSISEINDTISSIKAEIRQLDSIIDKQGICPYTDTKCDTISTLIDSLKNDRLKYTTELDACTQKYTELNDMINTNHAKISQLTTSKTAMMQEMDTIRQNYANANRLVSMVVPEIEYPDIPVSSIDARLNELLDIQVKLNVNDQYRNMIDKLVSEKYKTEARIAACKVWIKTTGVNGLQAESDAQFVQFGIQMDKFISKLFGSDTHAAFNVTTKANSFSFGISRTGNYIPYSMLSSGEKCMYMLSMMLCLVAYSESSLKLILVDDLFDHLDSENMRNLLESLYTVDDIQMIFAGVKEISSENSSKFVKQL